MTLHWWMHWFWITCHISLCACDTMARMHSPVISNQTVNVSSNNTEKKIGNSYYIPPMTKLSKVPKKHDSSTNLTNKALTTEYPLIKETTVIDQNFSDTSLDLTDANTTNVGHSGLNVSEYVNQTVVNSELIEAENQDESVGSLSAAGITGITLGCVSIIGVVCAVSFIMYRNYGLNRPQVLNDRCSNPDSSGYIDDSTVRENSEEMYSLDNDSFLNSLEAMTIQNLWTDTVKHTKL